MQISRHWRMNSQRYRLEGIRYQTGAVSLQIRPAARPVAREDAPVQAVALKVAVPAGR